MPRTDPPHESVDRDYCGRIFHGTYSDPLKKRLAQCISGFRLFERTGNPAMPYISAWEDSDQVIWYEFLSPRLLALLRCGASDVPEIFQTRISGRRVFKQEGVGGGITEENLGPKEIDGSRKGLREEGQRTGMVEAIYRMSLGDGRILWLKDHAAVETFPEDRIAISLGCLSDISKEMEVEEDFKRTQKELKEANQQLQLLAALDGLTQIANRRRFDEQLNLEWRRMSRDKNPLSLLMCDIDHFKLYNDTYGHQMGDDCLRAVARAISNALHRPADLAARYGGEEFSVILPNTDPEGALRVAQDIRERIRKLDIPHSSSPVRPFVTLSVGVATVVPSIDRPPEQLVERADQALYAAKEQGRDRILPAPTDSNP